MNKKASGFNLYNLLLGIVFLILGFISFKNPNINLKIALSIVGSIVVLIGVFQLVLQKRLINNFQINVPFIKVNAVISILIGISMIIFYKSSVTVISTFLAILFIIYSVNSITNLKYTKKLNTSFYKLNMTTSILKLIIGIMLLFNPFILTFSFSFAIGIYFIVAAIENFVKAFDKK